MKSADASKLVRFKNFMATNRIAQVFVVLAAIILLWLAYMTTSSLLSTMRSQSLVNAMATTLGDDYLQVEVDVSLDSQTTSVKLGGDLFLQGEDGVGVESKLIFGQVDQDPNEVDLKFTSSKDGQFAYIGEIDKASDIISQMAPGAEERVADLTRKMSDSWIELGSVDDNCYRNILKDFSREDSELRKEMTSAYIKNPLIRVYAINTLEDDSRDYYISPILSNSKGFARDINDSKVVEGIDGCDSGVEFLDLIATQSEENLNQLKSVEANTRSANIVVNVKDGRMASVRSNDASSAEGMVLAAEARFSEGEKGRSLPKPNMKKILDTGTLQTEFESIVNDAQQHAAMQQQQQGMPPQMGM